MSRELVVLAIALALGAAVVVLGLRRNLGETTRNGLPLWGDPQRATPRLGLYEGEERPRAPISARQRRWLASLYLLWALVQATSAVLSSHDRLFHAAMAALLVLGVGMLFLRKAHPPGETAA